MYEPQGNYDQNPHQWQQHVIVNKSEPVESSITEDFEKEDTSHRPPNAFILYSQAMRSEAQRQNPTLSNTEVSRILGKMWKEVPNEIKLQYKQKAAKMQEDFKKLHPDYTYRKARRKRALNELLTKSSYGGYPGFPAPGMQDQMAMLQMMQGASPMYQQMLPQGMPGQNMPQGMGQGMQQGIGQNIGQSSVYSVQGSGQMVQQSQQQQQPQIPQQQQYQTQYQGFPAVPGMSQQPQGQNNGYY
ncbi:HMG box family protein [Tritrichomonas foetus]|uniref:HMG box family protein n=1 Tax=Tritrichomonas foetus TaxID=1144522 RepID=A0A1J4JQ35_9EUKA|nr:HMG box family protein [Tritrichomonas foetus]|eukprot:OHT01225.1 HMG box family protein [Tritrichomonas foetus]